MAKKPKSKNKKKMSQGGKLVGPSHANGGIQGVVDGTEPIEVEGGEFIINKESAAALGDDFLHKLNATGTNMNGPGGFQQGQLGNGSNYQYGGNVRSKRSRAGHSRTNSNNRNKTLGGIIRGVTSEVDGHVHQYLIMPNGKVHILPAYHPNEKRIYHSHQYLGNTFPHGDISHNKSDCHPNCESMYGYKGVGSHNHIIPTVSDSATQSIKNRRTKKNVGSRFLSRKRKTRVSNRVDLTARNRTRRRR